MPQIRQLRNLLWLTFGIVPIIMGLDKFTNILTNWTDYLGAATNVLSLDPSFFMGNIGVIEITAGLIVLIWPMQCAYIVMTWLIAIAIQLVICTHHYDVAIRTWSWQQALMH